MLGVLLQRPSLGGVEPAGNPPPPLRARAVRAYNSRVSASVPLPHPRGPLGGYRVLYAPSASAMAQA